MVVVDEAFKGAGKKCGIEIWRIKEFRVLPLQKSEYGQFFEGDCYIVLSSKEFNDFDIHFWLGRNCTQTQEFKTGMFVHNLHHWQGSVASVDEYGTAAIKAIELDDLLGGGPVQYREMQDHESSLFLSYFKNGIKYLKGGYASGFEHVEVKWEPRLFQCKGKRNVRVRQVELTRDSLNKGDVFILDKGEDVYVWMPPDAGRLERIKGMQQARSIRDQERGGRPQIHVLDSDWDSCEEFWDHFGGYAEVAAGSSDETFQEAFVRTEKPNITLHMVSDASGKMEVKKVGEGDLTESMLDSKDAFILDAASGGIFVWIGKQCTMDERKKAMGYATYYLEEKGLPAWSQVIRVLDSAEPAIFTQWFKEPPKNRPRSSVRLFQCSDESGRLVVEEICNFSQEDLDGDDVMILDTGAVVYVWIGSGCSVREREHAQTTAQNYLRSDALPRFGGAHVETIEQGQEPSDFTKHFSTWNADMWMKRTVDSIKRLVLQ